MRWELLWKPGSAFERVGYKARQHRRLAKLQGTPAKNLAIGHIEALELLELARPLGIETIYDVGASVGTWTILAKAIIPEATIHAFEPLPKHCMQYGENLAGATGVQLHAIALGPDNTRTTIRVTNFSDGSSVLRLADAGREQFGAAEVEKIEVEMRRLDDFRVERNLPSPDLIKLDVQGFELEVLKGSQECLSHAKAVVVEVSFVEYYEGQSLFHATVGCLAKHGLFLAAFGDHTQTGTLLSQADALFLRGC